MTRRPGAQALGELPRVRALGELPQVRALLGMLVLLLAAGCPSSPSSTGTSRTARPVASASPAQSALSALSALSGRAPREIPLPPRPTSSANASSASSVTSASASPPAPSGSASVDPIARASGDACCRTTLGPVQLSFTAPVTFVRRAAAPLAPLVIVNRDGAPTLVPLPPTKLGKAERLALGQTPERLRSPACAAADPWIFCADRTGQIHRSRLDALPANDASEPDKVVAQGRPGAPISASIIGGSRVAYAFLADRKTTEGATTLAFLGVDEATPVLLSEEGAGATFVALARRAEDVIAMYVDARRVLTPVHARVVTAGDTLRLGRDAVVFVGSGTTGWTPAAIAKGTLGFEHFLVPLDKDDSTFGLATIRVEPEPRDDAQTVWSPYPAAVDRPVVVATQGTNPVYVLRTRPVDAQKKAKTALELGELDAAGAWTSRGTVAEGSSFSDLAIVVDGSGALWIAYTQGDATWIERRGGAPVAPTK